MSEFNWDVETIYKHSPVDLRIITDLRNKEIQDNKMAKLAQGGQ